VQSPAIARRRSEPKVSNGDCRLTIDLVGAALLIVYPLRARCSQDAGTSTGKLDERYEHRENRSLPLVSKASAQTPDASFRRAATYGSPKSLAIFLTDRAGKPGRRCCGKSRESSAPRRFANLGQPRGACELAL